jgi:hypothetical protein
MTIRRIASVAVALALAGCGSHTSSSTGTATHAGEGRPYQLYTHCGIEWARIDGTFWHAQHPLSDGSGNPPAGWGHPFQDGTLVFTSRNIARFDSPEGSVTFERTSRRQPPLICS